MSLNLLFKLKDIQLKNIYASSVSATKIAHPNARTKNAVFTKLTYIDVGQSPLQFSIRVSDTSVDAKTEVRK